jgi:hypothetical protein
MTGRRGADYVGVNRTLALAIPSAYEYLQTVNNLLAH